MASLNEKRQRPGGIVLESMTCFCFYGSDGGGCLNSVEKIRLEVDQEWEVLSLNRKIRGTYHIAAASFSNKIILFGGNLSASYNSYEFSE